MNCRTLQHLGAVAQHPQANFTEIQAVVDAVLRERRMDYEVTESDDSAFIEGRRADVTLKHIRSMHKTEIEFIEDDIVRDKFYGDLGIVEKRKENDVCDVRFQSPKKIGVFGEIHPEVISNFGLEHPIIGFELE